MHPRKVLSDSVFIVALCFLLFSCAVTPIEKVAVVRTPSNETRCGYIKTGATPITSGRIVELATELGSGRAPAQGILLCLSKKDTRPSVGSTSILDNGNAGSILIIWINERILATADEQTLRFALGHEIGHYVLPGGECDELKLRQYLTCEHEVDVYSAKIVGKSVAIHALSYFRRDMLSRNVHPANVALVSQRITLLRRKAGLPK